MLRLLRITILESLD